MRLQVWFIYFTGLFLQCNPPVCDAFIPSWQEFKNFFVVEIQLLAFTAFQEQTFLHPECCGMC